MIKPCTALTALLLLAWTCYGQDTPPGSSLVDFQWEFQQVEGSGWHPATVPGCVHTDLMGVGKLSDPFIGQGEEEAAWVGESDWEYRSRPFDLPRSVRSAERVLLRFEGLDTHADVYFNDVLVLRADNAFLPWEADVYECLKKRDNVVRVVFHSPLKKGAELAAQCPHSLPGDAVRAVTRKAQYQYGWDWGPTLPSMGISGPVSLQVVDGPRVVYRGVSTVSANAEKAVLNVRYDIEVTHASEVHLSARSGRAMSGSATTLHSGINTVETQLEIKHPDLWWPNGMGDQALTGVHCELNLNGRVLTDSLFTGVRVIHLDTTRMEQGRRFQLQVNGTPVFCKGANYIPQDVFLHRVQPEDYARLIDQCKDANFNMLRVWGGGVYERDLFYTLCDQAGILVWQDFMFACAMYPGDEAFIANVTREAKYHIRRLRGHPCVALWCGNNEVSEGWHRWGWQSGLSPEDAEQVWLSYQRLFQAVLPNLVETHSNLPYWESSPSLGRGDARFQFEGDAHDWTVWHDAAPFERFERVVPRFASEFGFQALPSQDVLQSMRSDSVPLTVAHPDVQSHQKHVRGFQLIDEYMERDFGGVPSNFNDYRYLSQYQQMRGMGMGLRAQRVHFPDCSGSLYWQLNDCWPVVSWSSIDSDGQWKLLHYEARRAFAPSVVHVHVLDNTLLVNAALTPNAASPNSEELLVEGTVTIQSLEGSVRKELLLETTVVPESGNQLLTYSLDSLLVGPGDADWAVVVDLSGNLEESFHEVFFPTSPKLQNLPSVTLGHSVEKVDDQTWRIQLRATHFAVGAELQASVPGKFSDNGFNMEPNRIRTIVFTADQPGQAPVFSTLHLGEVLGRLR